MLVPDVGVDHLVLAVRAGGIQMQDEGKHVLVTASAGTLWDTVVDAAITEGLFDEKYGTKVSIYGVGPGYRLDPGARDQRSRGGYYSLEFCGGPHVERTGVIGKIKITKEEAISSGIRRIRAEIVLR